MPPTGSLDEVLRFHRALDARIRELATCIVARHVSNQFEWVMHARLALQAGVAPEVIEALRHGARPRALAPDEEDVVDFAKELLTTHGVSDSTYESALARWGERGVVELTMLLGCFAMVRRATRPGSTRSGWCWPDGAGRRGRRSPPASRAAWPKYLRP